MNSPITFTKDEEQLSLYIMKVYPTDVSAIWENYTKVELLEKWWAPKPWKCETQKMDFREGGSWNYAMVSPENEKHFAGLNYQEINPHRSIAVSDFFTDENGNINTDLPKLNWLIGFTGIEQGTKLTFNIYFNSLDDMKQILEMGFEEGFKMQLNQLEEIVRGN